jgi:hypothetical protein
MTTEQKNQDLATREEVLMLLSAKAREGSTSAMIALERALRTQAEAEGKPHDEIWAELYAEAPRRSPGPA